MPLFQQNFETLDPNAGAETMSRILQAAFQNQLMSQQARQMGIQNQYLPESLQAQNLAQSLANQKSQAQLPYAGPQAAADLAYRQAQTPYLNSQTASTYAGIPLTQAQTQKVNLENKYMPLNYALDVANSQRLNNRFGPSHDLSKLLNSMDPAARATWISQNQGAYNQMMSDVANSVTNPMAMGGLSPEFVNQYLPGYFSSSNVPNGVTPNRPLFSPSTQEQIDTVKKANEMGANKKLTTAATNRQIEGAIQVQQIINDPGLNERAFNASQYAGAAGKGKSFAAALSQKNPKAYEDYLSFKNDMILLQNRIKTLDQMGGTDKQREELQSLYKKSMDSFTSNPEQFMIQFNNLKASLDNVARGVQKSASPLFNVNRLENSQKSSSPTQIVRVQAPNGKIFSGPSDKVEAFLKAHPDHRRVN